MYPPSNGIRKELNSVDKTTKVLKDYEWTRDSNLLCNDILEKCINFSRYPQVNGYVGKLNDKFAQSYF